MSLLHWTWAAILVELSVFFSPLLYANDTWALIAVLALHSLASAIVASGTYLLQPAHFKKPRVVVWLLLFSFAFVAPVIGAIGMLLIIRTTLRNEGGATRYPVPEIVTLPEYDVQAKDVNRSGQGAIRSRLESNVPSDIRMRSLMTLQAVPPRVANPILEDLLGDDADDVRLVAFGMLDSEEKKLNAHIQREQDHMTQTLTPEQRYTCLRQLAELHWELIYTSLAQGELRRHILNRARHYLDAALALDLTPDSGLMFLKGRVLLEQGEVAIAQDAMEQALALGQPLSSALPYLAEMAFKRRDFVCVQQYMNQLAELNVASRTRAIVDFWTGRDNVSNFSDRRYLPHI